MPGRDPQCLPRARRAALRTTVMSGPTEEADLYPHHRMDGIVFREMTRDDDPFAVMVATGRTSTRLPVGYATTARTRLRGAPSS